MSMLLLAGLALAAQDPLAPARDGKLQCTMPDRVKKTCIAISRYVPLSETHYRNETRLLLSVDPLTVLEMTAPTDIEGGAACGVLRRDYLADARVWIAGKRLPAAAAEPIIAEMARLTTADIGKRICTTTRPVGDMMVQESAVDGVPNPDASLPFIWIGPDEGYMLGMANSSN